jgi:hypothetical protein
VKQKLQEDFIEYLSSYEKYVQNPQFNQFTLRGLVNDPELKNEFTIYQHEGIQIGDKTDLCYALLTPTLNEKAICDNFVELDSLQLALKEEAKKLYECIELIRQTTNQHKIELDYQLTSTTEEANAKIRACEEFVIPQVTRLNRKYKRKIKETTITFNKKIRDMENKRNRAKKTVDRSEEKISLYRMETRRQASRGHYYEKRWAKKFARLERELNRCSRKLDSIESSLERVTDLKETEIVGLTHELDTQTELVSQPLRAVEMEKSRKITYVRQKIQRLIELEDRLIDGINKNVEGWELERSLQSHSLKGISLTAPALVYVQFYFICYQSKDSKRFLIISPSFFGKIDFSAKFKGVFGVTKIKNLLNPRFQTMTTLTQKVQEIAMQNVEFESQLLESAQKQNLLKNNTFKNNAQEGLVYLKQEGWLSDKEQQSLSRQLSS